MLTYTVEALGHFDWRYILNGFANNMQLQIADDAFLWNKSLTSVANILEITYHPIHE